MAFVLDNSVLMGWFIPSQADAYTRRCNLRARREAVLVPAFRGNRVCKRPARARVAQDSRHEAHAALQHADRLPLTIDREPVPPRSVFELGERRGISPYDATYLELAQRRGLPLATRDRRLTGAARAAGVALA
jgi:predicted nucleic acid-binding protein